MTNELDMAPIEARAEKVCQRTTSENYGTEEWLAFCAHAKHDIPALITEVERLCALLEKRDGEPYEAMRARLAQALKENEELRANAELGRLVRELLPRMAERCGDEARLSYDHIESLWQLGCTGEDDYIDCELDAMLQTAWGDVPHDLGEGKTLKGKVRS